MKSAQSDPEAKRVCLRRAGWGIGVLTLASLAGQIFAEVSVVTDPQGRYVRTLVIGESRGGERHYWSPVRQGVDRRLVLNIGGDRRGDGPPVVAEQPGTRQPWVVWSVSDGHDREIAFATWSQGRWQGPALLERIDNPFDDLNPRLSFDSQGRPIVVWWRNEPIARVYMSVFRNGGWSVPLAVSDAATPSRFPSIRVQGNQAIISFYTSRGQTVLFLDLSVQMDGDGPLDGPVPPPGAGGDPSQGTPDGQPTSTCGGNCSEIRVQKPSDLQDQ